MNEFVRVAGRLGHVIQEEPLVVEAEDSTVFHPAPSEVRPVEHPTLFVRTWQCGDTLRWYVGDDWEGRGFTVERGEITCDEETRKRIAPLIRAGLKKQYLPYATGS